MRRFRLIVCIVLVQALGEYYFSLSDLGKSFDNLVHIVSKAVMIRGSRSSFRAGEKIDVRFCSDSVQGRLSSLSLSSIRL